MSNQDQAANDAAQAAKTASPGQANPAPQQNQGDSKPNSDKPAQQK